MPPRPPRCHSLSALLICRDEADRIQPCLESLSGWVDEIIVLDSGSRDATVEIARRYTNQVYQTDWPGFGAQRQRALDKASGDYVFSIDADERVDAALREEIDRLLSQADPGCASWSLRWAFWFLGARIRHGRFESPQTRLFRREGLSWPPLPVHESPVLPPGPQGRLQGRLEHHSFRDLRHAFDKYTEYAWLIARRNHQRGKRSTALQAVGRGAGEFLLQYFIRGLVLDGARGLMLALLLSYYAFLKYAALWSLRISGAPRDSASSAQH